MNLRLPFLPILSWTFVFLLVRSQADPLDRWTVVNRPKIGVSDPVFGNGLYVGKGSENLLFSRDGKDWFYSLLPEGELSSPVFGNGRFFISLKKWSFVLPPPPGRPDPAHLFFIGRGEMD